MLKPIARSSELSSKQINDDIQFLLSNIRARENGLIFFLERFSEQCKTHDEFGIYKQQFLQKQKIYANQIHRVIEKLSQNNTYDEEIRQYTGTFWIKVKSIIKVSLDRLRMLKLLNQRIFSRYEEIINLINKNYDEQKKIEQFGNIENLLKKRNVDALIYSRNYFDSPGSENKINKNRSQSAFKNSSKFTPKPHRMVEDSFGNEGVGLLKLNFQEDEEQDPEIRMKSLNRYRRKKIILGKSAAQKSSEKIYKKIIKNIDKYQKSLEGAMDCVIEIDIDKKKSMKENSETLYDGLFNKNIPNHKMISKFLFGACGIAQLLIKRKQLKNKKSLLGKTDKNNRQSKQGDKKIKLKQSKQLKEKEKDKEKEKQKQKQKQKDKQRQKQRQREKDRQKFGQKSKDRPQTSLTAQIKGIFQEQKRRMIQTTLILQDKKNNKYKRKIGGRIQKYTKMVKLIS